MKEVITSRVLRTIFFMLIVVVLCPFAYGKIIYVDEDGTVNADGSSWQDAYICLKDALAVAQYGDEIRVAQGTYKPDQKVVITRGGAQVTSSGDRTETFQLINGVSIEGGYAGFGEPDPDVRDIAEYETILSGDLNGDDVEVSDATDLRNEPTRADNSHHVVTGSGTVGTAVLDGFTISGGFALSGNGAGMYNRSGSPTVTNCLFLGNSVYSDVANYGGGMYNIDRSAPIVANCTFSGNSAQYGGGMSNYADSSPIVTRCTFSGNVAGAGGGMHNSNCSVAVTNCNFAGNSGERGGGGMLNIRVRNSTLANCLFSGNYRAGLANFQSSLTVVNCTLSGNSAEHCGGIYNNDNSNVVLQNCILWANTAPTSPQMTVYEGSIVRVSYSNVQDGPDRIWTDGHGADLRWGDGNIDADPLFAVLGYYDENVTPADANDDYWVDGDYHLKSQAGRFDTTTQTWIVDDVTSPCIDAGDPNSPLAFEPYPNGGIINMGAYGGTVEASKSPSGLHTKYGGGTGEPNDPYLIYTAEQMNAIGAEPNDWDKHFKLMADINLSAYTGTSFNIIGIDLDNAFTGVFDGNSHTISNFSYTSTDTDRIGLFGYVGSQGGFGPWGEKGEIKDLGFIDPNIDAGTGRNIGSLVGYNVGTITGCYAEGGSVSGDNNVGGLVGFNWWGRITNCYVQGGSVSGWSGVGGLLGGNGDNGYSGTITNCYSTGTVSGNSNVGGLVGSSEYGGRIINCYTNCNVTGGDYVGGLAGGIGGEVYIPLVVPNIITNCYSIGGVSGRNLVGGLVGDNYNGTITNCYSTSSVVGNDYVGGLVGDNFFGSIATSYSSGAVSGTSGVGGLVGLNAFWGSIATSYSTGTVSGNSKVGGLVGENVFVNLFGDESKGIITTSYSIGTVTGNENVGGLVGSGWASDVTNCFWDMETSGQTSSAGGTGKTTAEIQMENTFTDAGWDFVDESVNGTEDIWRILEGQDYPRLWWETFSELEN